MLCICTAAELHLADHVARPVPKFCRALFGKDSPKRCTKLHQPYTPVVTTSSSRISDISCLGSLTELIRWSALPELVSHAYPCQYIALHTHA